MYSRQPWAGGTTACGMMCQQMQVCPAVGHSSNLQPALGVVSAGDSVLGHNLLGMGAQGMAVVAFAAHSKHSYATHMVAALENKQAVVFQALE